MPPKGSTRSTPTRLQDKMAKAQALSFFSTSIQDPNNPLHCGMCIDGALIECTKKERRLANEPHNIKPTRPPKCDPDVWNTVVAFMFYKRTDEQMKRLVERMSDCECRDNEGSGTIKRYHQLAEMYSQQEGFHIRMMSAQNEALHPELQSFSLARCTWVIDVFQTLIFALAGLKTTLASKSISNTWPCSLTDLFPFGADSFVQSLLQWYHLVPDPIIFRLTGIIVGSCQMLVIPYLIKNKFTDIVIHSTRKVVDRAMVALSFQVQDVNSMCSISMFSTQMDAIRKYFEMILSPDSLAALLRGCETKAFQLFSIIVYLYKEYEVVLEVGVREEMEYFVQLGQKIFRLFYMHRSPLPSFPVHPLLYQMDVAIFLASSQSIPPVRFESNILMIRRLRHYQQCSAEGCINSIQVAGQSFQRCNGCGITPYCGRECQTNAWKHERYSHKLICAALRNLVEKGGGPSFFFSGECRSGTGHPQNRTILPKILQNWKTVAPAITSDLVLICDWWTLVGESKGYPLPDGTEWTPGYEDYDEVIARLSGNGRGPQPKYLNRDARWPREVERDRRLLKIQPFWGQELDFDSR